MERVACEARGKALVGELKVTKKVLKGAGEGEQEKIRELAL